MCEEIENLQIKVAYLESLHEELNEVVVKLQDENMRFKKELREIKEHMQNSADPGANATEKSLFEQLADEKPPHY
jgi:uncharacterized coiled-coil protein SlyX